MLGSLSKKTILRRMETASHGIPKFFPSPLKVYVFCSITLFFSVMIYYPRHYLYSFHKVQTSYFKHQVSDSLPVVVNDNTESCPYVRFGFLQVNNIFPYPLTLFLPENKKIKKDLKRVVFSIIQRSSR